MYKIQLQLSKISPSEDVTNLQKWLADELEVTQPYISQLSNGKKSPSLSFIFKMAKLMECTPGEVLDKYLVVSPENFKAIV